jgi:hypothetical protein
MRSYQVDETITLKLKIFMLFVFLKARNTVITHEKELFWGGGRTPRTPYFFINYLRAGTAEGRATETL